MSGSPALAAYLLASRLAGPLAPPILRRRLARGKEDPTRLAERLGHAGASRPDGQLIWLHGASVGEAMSMLPLIDALRARTSAEVLVTTGTVTSARRLAGNLPVGVRHQYVPVDTQGAVRRFLDHWRPDLAIWIESELWPRLVVDTSARGVPMAIVNARLSARSHTRWQRARGMAADLFGRFKVILTQDNETVERLASIGAASRFAGNLKALVALPDPDPDEAQRFGSAMGDRPVWLAASTHVGEDEILLQAQRTLCADTGCLMILAPRHPERADSIAALATATGLSVARRSAGQMPGPGTDVFLADTLGEMALWYTLAPVTFVGGSLAPRGGHTPFEPILGGSAVVHGPHVDNFAPAYAALHVAEAAEVASEVEAIAAMVHNLLTNEAPRKAMHTRALAAHEALRPDVGAIADTLVALMEDRG